MMNLYREEETSKPEKDKLKVKLDFSYKTSKFYRNKSIKAITKAIKNLQPADVEKIKNIAKIINETDLCDSRFGKTIEKSHYYKLISIVHQNKDLKETENDLRKNLVCYDQEVEI